MKSSLVALIMFRAIRPECCACEPLGFCAWPAKIFFREHPRSIGVFLRSPEQRDQSESLDTILRRQAKSGCVLRRSGPSKGTSKARVFVPYFIAQSPGLSSRRLGVRYAYIVRDDVRNFDRRQAAYSLATVIAGFRDLAPEDSALRANRPTGWF